jgi:hypothetical protein
VGTVALEFLSGKAGRIFVNYGSVIQIHEKIFTNFVSGIPIHELEYMNLCSGIGSSVGSLYQYTYIKKQII